MSFIISVYTNEGIIMASDSRSTYTTTNILPSGVVERQIGVQVTDTTYKTFLCQGKIGISTCGNGDINGVPITGYIEDFITKETTQDSTVDTVAEGILQYFSKFTPLPATIFVVAGYSTPDLKQQIRRVFISEGKIFPVDCSSPGTIWNGESDIFTRIVNSSAAKNADGSYLDLPNYNTSFRFFTLQDAIDYAEYAVDVTIKTMFFQDRVKTVGGPIDILAIKPTGGFWIQRKELHA